MNTIKFLAVALMATGILSLVYGGFTYTKETQAAKLGPIELTVKEQRTVNVPIWAGIAAIVAGGALLLVSNKKG